MSGRDEELLSAYIDGELAGDERSSVEQWLADDVAARESLDELAETSGWIRSLPRAAAPAGIHDEVLARLRAARTATPRPTPAMRPNWRRRVTWVASSAAGLLLTFVLYWTWPSADDRRLAEVELTGGQEASRTTDLDADFGRRWAAYDTQSVNAPTTAATAGSVVAQPPDPTRLALTNSLMFQEQLTTALQRGELPVPGEMLEQLGQVGDQVVIIQYRVVDTQDMFGHVQVLLAQNGIIAVNEAAMGEALLADRHDNGQLQAIYLDAPPPNFTAAVNDITKLESVTAVTTNTVAFVDDTPARNLDELDQFASKAESVAPLSPSNALAESRADAAGSSNNGVLPAPASAPTDSVPAAEAEESRPADQPAELSQLGVNANRSSAASAQTAGGESPASGEAKDAFAYQVVVPARQELLQELEDHQNVFLGSEGRDQSVPESERLKASGKQVRRLSFNFAAPPVQGPPAKERVRAVILLVPEKPK